MSPNQVILFVLFAIALERCQSSVSVSGGPNCLPNEENGVQADPNSVITVNCTVFNPSNLANLLHWTLYSPPSYDISISHVNADPPNQVTDNTHPDFQSTVIDSNNSPSPPDSNKSTTASLSFPAVSTLDGSVVKCSNVLGTFDNCTLYVKTVPSSPISPLAVSRTYESVLIQWTPPTDDGVMDSALSYILSVSPPSMGGTCAGGTCSTGLTRFNVTELQFGATYVIAIAANNTVGAGSAGSLSVAIPGNVPPAVEQVTACFNYSNGQTRLHIAWSPCPVIITTPTVTPPLNGYTVTITKQSQGLTEIEVGVDCNGSSQPITEGDYTVGVSARNAVGLGSIVITDQFSIAWLHSITLSNVSRDGSATLEYTTASTNLICSTLSLSGLQIYLTLSNGVTSTKSYISQTTNKFLLSSLDSAHPLSYTLRVIDAEGNPVGGSHTGDIFSPMSLTSSSPVISSTNTPTATATGVSNIIIIGAAAGGGALVLLSFVLLFLVCCCCCCRNRRSTVTESSSPVSRAAVYEVASVSESKDKTQYYEDVVYNDGGHTPIESIPETKNESYGVGKGHRDNQYRPNGTSATLSLLNEEDSLTVM